MNKTDLIDHVQQSANIGRAEATAAVDSIVDTIVRSVRKGENVTIVGFGVFEKARRAPRTARNIRTGEKIRLRAKNVPAFRPASQFKAIVAGSEKLPRTGVAVGRGSQTSATTRTAAKTKNATTAAKKTTTASSSRSAAPAKRSQPKKATAAKTARSKAPKTARSKAPKAAPERSPKTAKKTATPASKSTTRKASSPSRS
ncbi:HU family DNA-binding protein [Gordonia otitidis]|uniref:DNA-binding protein HupB n=1 Tax=Gordonia otitidis (strain DSM 44809 / CCUG 52243 / JCM 12355 / NBRC 100426 / IFM 10032) TaxID=1108044 RepID=H5TS17_GORO1|nr:HU family DNA-binding protein [Gordonia otitidis]GAB36275.1 hypothetical protein GOOTI_206_00080 [Gordonia otitidis NBRC 100426]